MQSGCVTFIDLFAGCGGFSVGLEMAGLKGVANIEIDEWACASLRQNFPSAEVIQQDIRTIGEKEIMRFKGVDLIVGGPPCQGFSVAGSSQFGIDDPRNELAKYFLYWVSIIRPRFAVIENVPQILTKRVHEGLSVGDYICNTFLDLGYEVSCRVLIAADYGVPQLRKRAFIVANLSGFTFNFPRKTKQQHSGQKSLLFDLPNNSYVSVWEAISDLPQVNSGEGKDEHQDYASGEQNEYQRIIRNNSHFVCNHIAMRHTQRLIERFKTIRPGTSLKDVAIEHGQLRKNSGEVNMTPFKSNNYRLDPQLPALSIPASFQSLFLHPYLDRNLTAREAARIMSFPDTFIFKGNRTAMSWEKSLSQYNQIGNAVCPLMAKAIGEEILDSISSGTIKDISMCEHKIDVNIISAKPASKIILDRRMSLPAGLKLSLSSAFIEYYEGIAPDNVCSGAIIHDGIAINPYMLSIALLISTEQNCCICDNDLPPFGSHQDCIPLLISKSGIDSLVSNHNDHGLDFHLKAFDQEISFEHTQAIASFLHSIHLCKLKYLTNPRTGRLVRGLAHVKCPTAVELRREETMLFISNHFSCHSHHGKG